MSKYQPLTAWLTQFAGDRVTLPFGQVEDIIGSPLPASSYNHEAHWRGSTLGRPGGAIAGAGWGVDRVDQMGRSVTLFRRDARSNRTPAAGSADGVPTPAGRVASAAGWQSFEDRARRYFSQLWGVELLPRRVAVGDALKSFDLVSADLRIIGDAKSYSDAAGASGKRSTIFEYVTLMQAVPADRRFLVFERRVVATDFLKRWRSVVSGVDFYVLEGDRHEEL